MHEDSIIIREVGPADTLGFLDLKADGLLLPIGWRKAVLVRRGWAACLVSAYNYS